MTLKQTLSHAREMLEANDIEDFSLESELLLRHTLNKNRVQLYQDLEEQLSSKQEEDYWNLIERRLNHEPTAYITGHREFYGLDFYVNPNVLIPRPESELLVELALSTAANQQVSTIADIGTGCGVIAISLALNLPHVNIYATDISASALEVAQINCNKHGVAKEIHLLQGDMLNPLPEPVDLIVANLPYVRKADLPRIIPAKFEPLLALDGGPDGLQKVSQLCRQVKNKLRPTGYLLLEIGQGQRKAVTSLLHSFFQCANIEVALDLGSIDRVVSLFLSPNK